MQKFDTPAPVSALVDIPAGRIEFIAADRAATSVEVLPADSAKSRDVKAAEQIAVAYADGVLRVAAPEPANRGLGHSGGSVAVTVRLPAGSRVEVRAAAAEFHSAGRLGDVLVEGGHRVVRLDEAASARVSALDADVTVGRLDGDSEISTQRGRIELAEAMGGTVTLRTEQGDISVTAAHGVPAALDAGTPYGRIVNSLTNTGGSPALTVRATTAQGDITARSL